MYHLIILKATHPNCNHHLTALYPQMQIFSVERQLFNREEMQHGQYHRVLLARVYYLALETVRCTSP